MKILPAFVMSLLLAPSAVAAQQPTNAELLEAIREAQAEARLAREKAEDLQRQLTRVIEELGRRRDGGAPAPDPVDRLTKVEEQVEVNTAQIREHAQTKVESESKFRVRLSGMVLANMYHSSDDTQRTTPLVAPPPTSPEAVTRGTFGSTFRQTVLGLHVDGPRVGGARLSADLDMDFYGGTVAQQDGDVLGALRLRTAAARLDWERTALVVGQEAPVISPRNPTSLAAVWFAPLSSAGNLWQWRPQVIVEHRPRVTETTELVLQGSVMPPFGESVGGISLAGRPAYEARVALRRGPATDRVLEVGAGGHYGRRSFGFGRDVDAYIVSGDWLVPLGGRVELSGELYHGRSVSLSETSGARIDRHFAFSGPVDDPATSVRGIDSTGGWAQLSFQARRDLELNFAYGQEDPSDRDIRAGLFTSATRFRNQVASANLIYQLRPSFLVALEYRRLWTDYAAARRTNNHYNLGVAYVF